MSINKANYITFSQCAFINNHCKDEGGAIYLDSGSSYLTLKKNIFRIMVLMKEKQYIIVVIIMK